MIALLDTDILAGVWIGNIEARSYPAHARRAFTLIISPVVYTELFAHPQVTEAALDSFLEGMNIAIAPLSTEVFALAGRRFAAYADQRRQAQQEGRRRIAVDFILGAHAVSTAAALVTLDQGFFKRNFPETSSARGVTLDSPSSALP